MTRSGLAPKDLVQFIGKQAEWWNATKRIGPAAVAEEYKCNIASAMLLHRLVTKASPQKVVNKVGRHGHFRPILEIIFPDWLEEQRELTIRSLIPWAKEHLDRLPVPFPTTETEIAEFCDWLERKGLYQYYWHFNRLVDLGIHDRPVERAATAAEAVGFGNLCEMIANQILVDRGELPRGKTLAPKLRRLFGSSGPVDLTPYFERYRNLTNTRTQSLAQRLAQLDRIGRGGQYTSIARSLLKLIVIRNEGAHLGLLRYNRIRIIAIIETMAVAALLMWKVR